MAKRGYNSGGNWRDSDFDWRAEQRAKEAAEKEAMMRKIGEYTVADVVEIHKTMLEQDKLLERLTKAAITYGRIIDFDGDMPVVGGLGGSFKTEKPNFPVYLGDWVVCSEDTKQIIERSARPMVGEVVTISRIIDQERAEVGSITGGRLLRIPPDVEIKVGEEWLAGSEGILIHKLVKIETQEQTDFKPVYWYDIGGLDAVKLELQESIALLQGEMGSFADRFMIAQPKGLLLYGPPGNGKTMLGRAVATQLSGDMQQFIYVKGPEILSKFVGMSEEIIRRLFLKAKEGHARTGMPSVIFIDECDAIMNVRGSGRSSDVERTIVPAFLTEMDGLERNHAFIMLATNRPDTLDPAIIREGRIDKHILIGAPDREAIKAIFCNHLSGLPCEEFYEEIAEQGTDAIGHCKEISGALVVAVIERAKRLAMRRAIETSMYNNAKLCVNDILHAVEGARERSL